MYVCMYVPDVETKHTTPDRFHHDPAASKSAWHSVPLYAQPSFDESQMDECTH